MKKIFLLALGIVSCAAKHQEPLVLDEAFYDVVCTESGDLMIKVRSNYCDQTGLYSIRAQAFSKGGRSYDVTLVNDDQCNSPVWSAALPNLKCSSDKDVRGVKLTAYVDPKIWKVALDAQKKSRAK